MPPAQLGGTWTEKILYNFNNLSTVPQGDPTSIVMDASGSLYGATSYTDASKARYGTVFQLSPPAGGSGAWAENLLYAFTGENGDGIEPSGGLVFDSSGALYGVALEGGQTGASGTVYRLAPPSIQGGLWTESVIHSFFPGFGDGGNPLASLAFDDVGSLYGVSESGGADTCSTIYNGCGTIFKLSPPSVEGGDWTEQVLHSFAGGSDGAWIQGFSAPLVAGTTIFGTTLQGGTGVCDQSGDGSTGCGTVFQVTQP